MTLIYMAEDGKQFYNEEECLNYENAAMYEKYTQQNLIRGLDICGDEIKYSHPAFCDEVCYLYLANQDAANQYNIRLWDEGFLKEEFGPGAYAWDDNLGHWLDISEEIKCLTARIENLKKCKKLLTE